MALFLIHCLRLSFKVLHFSSLLYNMKSLLTAWGKILATAHKSVFSFGKYLLDGDGNHYQETKGSIFKST